LLPELRITNVCDIVEDDEEVFLRSTIQDLPSLKHIKMNEDFVESDSDELTSNDTCGFKDLCLSEQPMKDAHKDFPTAQQAPVCPDFYPLEHDDWENGIIWGNSPTNESQASLKSCVISEESADTQSKDTGKDYGNVSRCSDVQSKNNGSPMITEPVTTEPFGCTEIPASASYHYPENSYPLLRNETPQEKNDLDNTVPNNINGTFKIDTMKCLNNLSRLNKELLEGSWLDNIIWDPSQDTPKPKLILDLKDEQMLFEILDEKNGDHLRSHARAMIVTRSMKTSTVGNFDHNNQAVTLDSQFDISNDKFYSNRKMSQQAKSHTKKRSSMGIKVVHSVPAQKLQFMKPLSEYEPPYPLPYLFKFYIWISHLVLD
jgi:transcription initiation factor TFIID subunit 1